MRICKRCGWVDNTTWPWLEIEIDFGYEVQTWYYCTTGCRDIAYKIITAEIERLNKLKEEKHE